MAEHLKRGLIQVYTGDGKGKTTAALGLALRAAGWGLKTHFIQFLKGGKATGEIRAVEPLQPNLVVSQFGSGRFIIGRQPDEEEKALARNGLAAAGMDFASHSYDLIVLDEISHAVNLGLVVLEDVMTLLAQKPPEVEVVLTGRNMPPAIIELADLVTEMVPIKHPMDRGIEARRGIEY